MTTPDQAARSAAHAAFRDAGHPVEFRPWGPRLDAAISAYISAIQQTPQGEEVRKLIEKLRELEKQATPGPWRSMRNGNSSDGKKLCGSSRVEGLPRAYHPEGLWYAANPNVTTLRDEDADFVEAARYGIPVLLAELDRMASTLSRLTAQTPQPASPTPAEGANQWAFNCLAAIEKSFRDDGFTARADELKNAIAALTALEGERDRAEAESLSRDDAARLAMRGFMEMKERAEAAEQSLTAEREKNGRMEGALQAMADDEAVPPWIRTLAAGTLSPASIAKPAEHKEPQG